MLRRPSEIQSRPHEKQSLPSPEEEFVFGQFTSPQLGITTQVPIRSIAQRAGLDFGNLAEIDPLASDEESVDGAAGTGIPLATLESIRRVTSAHASRSPTSGC